MLSSIVLRRPHKGVEIALDMPPLRETVFTEYSLMVSVDGLGQC